MDDPRTTAKHCAGIRRDGQPCAAPMLDDGPYCFAHDPSKAAARQAARRKGGHNRGAIVRLRGLVPPRLLSVYDELEAALNEVHVGALPPARALAMAAVARAMVAVLQAGEQEERLRTVEARLGTQPQKGPSYELSAR
jgi:hypothetical protein